MADIILGILCITLIAIGHLCAWPILTAYAMGFAVGALLKGVLS